MLRTLKSPRRLAAVAVFAIVALSAFGFAATNTFPNDAGKAGHSGDDISGFTVTAVGYGLQDTNPAYLDEVHFTLDTAASEVHVRFSDGGGTPTFTAWYDCSAGTAITCDVDDNSVAVTNAWTLEVSAVS